MQYKLVSVDYFMNEMQDWEASLLLEQIKYADRAAWERCRFLAYVQASTWSKKKLKPGDLIKFAWEKDDLNDDTTISNEDIAALDAESARWESWLQQKQKN